VIKEYKEKVTASSGDVDSLSEIIGGLSHAVHEFRSDLDNALGSSDAEKRDMREQARTMMKDVRAISEEISLAGGTDDMLEQLGKEWVKLSDLTYSIAGFTAGNPYCEVGDIIRVNLNEVGTDAELGIVLKNHEVEEEGVYTIVILTDTPQMHADPVHDIIVTMPDGSLTWLAHMWAPIHVSVEQVEEVLPTLAKSYTGREEVLAYDKNGKGMKTGIVQQRQMKRIKAVRKYASSIRSRGHSLRGILAAFVRGNIANMNKAQVQVAISVQALSDELDSLAFNEFIYNSGCM